MRAAAKDSCPLCGQPVHLVADGFPGYRVGMRYSIMECESCAASHASPLLVDEGIYGQIYEQISCVPGYNRYHHYAGEVLRRPDPLTYLSRQEESYWAVARALRTKRTGAGRLKVLEVGCGLGYFTYAMVRDGFDVIGVDISPKAIAWASDHYGPYYAEMTMEDLKSKGERYDFIVMNQLIEHIPDVHTFLSDALKLLSGEGDLIMTTPNKSVYQGGIWETDLPPVHLWWFGEEAMRYLAARHGCTVSFVDFAQYTDKHFRVKDQPGGLADRHPILDELGTVIVRQEIAPDGKTKRLIERAGAMDLLRSARGALQRKARWRGARGPILAALFRSTW